MSTGSMGHSRLAELALGQRLVAAPGLISALADEALLRLAASAAYPLQLRVRLAAELCLRLWQRQGRSLPDEPPALLAETVGQALASGLALPEQVAGLTELARLAQRRALGETRGTASIPGLEPPATPAAVARLNEFWQHLRHQLGQAERADGWVLAVTQPHADLPLLPCVPLPFRLIVRPSSPLEGDNEAPLVHDAEDQPVAQDLQAAASQALAAMGPGQEPGGVQFSSLLPGLPLTGRSVALAFLLALKLQQLPQKLAEPLAVLASGDIQGGHLKSVSELTAKARLAALLGARLLLHCGHLPPPRLGPLPLQPLALESGLSTSAALAAIEQALADRRLLRERSLDTIAAELERLKEELTESLLPPADVRRRTERLHHYLSQRPGLQARELCLDASLQVAHCHSYEGRPDDALARLTAARDEAEQLRCFDKLARTRHLLMRAYTQNHQFDRVEAEYAAARDLLDGQRYQYRNLSERQEMAMKAAGCAGLARLCRGLHDPDWLEPARELLTLAVNCARELGDGKEETFAKRVLLLWEVIVQPAAAAAKVANELRQLPAMTGIHAASAIHLQRYQLLIPYRCLLQGQPCAPPAAHEPPLAREHWVAALCHKYLGAIHAAHHDAALARQHFATAWDLLRRERQSQREFMALTVLLQAGDSLLGSAEDAYARDCLTQALAALPRWRDTFPPPVHQPAWERRARGLLAGAPRTTLPHPQLYYPY